MISFVCMLTPATAAPLIGIDWPSLHSSGIASGAFAEIGGLGDVTVGDVLPNFGGRRIRIRPNGTEDAGRFSIDYGGYTFDASDYELSVPIHIRDGNLATEFEVSLIDLDSGGADEFFYSFDISQYGAGSIVTLSQSLMTPTRVSQPTGYGPGDGILNMDLESMHFNGSDLAARPLDIQVDGIHLQPTIDDNVAFELNTNSLRRGSLQGGVTNDGHSIVFNAVTGSASLPWAMVDFDPLTHDLVVTARLKEENTADGFEVVLKDYVTFIGRQLQFDSFGFQFSTADFSSNEFTKVRQSFYEPGPAFSAPADGFGFGAMNFGLFETQVQTIRDSLDRLNIEIASVAIVESRENCDVDLSGECNERDINVLHEAIRSGTSDLRFDLNETGRVDSDDAYELVLKRFRTIPGDSNLDGVFDSNDLVLAFQGGFYGVIEPPADRKWSEGDWDGDGAFVSQDLIVALRLGNYRRSARPVPEPGPHVYMLGVLMGHLLVRRSVFAPRAER